MILSEQVRTDCLCMHTYSKLVEDLGILPSGHVCSSVTTRQGIHLLTHTHTLHLLKPCSPPFYTYTCTVRDSSTESIILDAYF